MVQPWEANGSRHPLTFLSLINRVKYRCHGPPKPPGSISFRYHTLGHTPTLHPLINAPNLDLKCPWEMNPDIATETGKRELELPHLDIDLVVNETTNLPVAVRGHLFRRTCQ